MAYSPAVGNFPVYPPGLGIQGNSLQGLLQVSHKQCCLTFRRKKRKDRVVNQPYEKAFRYTAHLLILIDYYSVLASGSCVTLVIALN